MCYNLTLNIKKYAVKTYAKEKQKCINYYLKIKLNTIYKILLGIIC